MHNKIGIILAAGKGTRMKSDLPKPLVLLNSKPIINYIIESYEEAGLDEIVLVVGHKSDMIKKHLGNKAAYVEQRDQKGTGHAIMEAKKAIAWKDKDVLVFVGDSPLITTRTIKRLCDYHHEKQADCTFLTADFKLDLPYGRVVKDKAGKLIKCVEEKDANPEELKIRELLSSHYIFKGNSLFRFIDQLQPDKDTGEYFLTDIIEIFILNELKVEILKIENFEELVGLNTPEDLAWAEEILKSRR